MREGEAIYLWLGLEGVLEPRSFALPWNEAMARQLHGAQGEAEETGTELRVRMPLVSSLDKEEPMFYAEPQQPPPPKTAPSNNEVWFEKPQGQQ